MLHEKSINDYGGSIGIRDLGLLESAVARPFQTFGDIDLYLSCYEKAAAIIESIVKNHPFVDRDKTTGFLAGYAVLYRCKVLIIATNESAYKFVIDVASFNIAFEEIVKWLQQNTAAI